MKKRKNNLRNVVINNIKYYRKKSGITTKELSLKLGKNEKFIDNLEAEIYSKAVTILLLEDISNILNIPIVYLFLRKK